MAKRRNNTKKNVTKTPVPPVENTETGGKTENLPAKTTGKKEETPVENPPKQKQPVEKTPKTKQLSPEEIATEKAKADAKAAKEAADKKKAELAEKAKKEEAAKKAKAATKKDEKTTALATAEDKKKARIAIVKDKAKKLYGLQSQRITVDGMLKHTDIVDRRIARGVYTNNPEQEAMWLQQSEMILRITGVIMNAQLEEDFKDIEFELPTGQTSLTDIELTLLESMGYQIQDGLPEEAITIDPDGQARIDISKVPQSEEGKAVAKNNAKVTKEVAEIEHIPAKKGMTKEEWMPQVSKILTNTVADPRMAAQYPTVPSQNFFNACMYVKKALGAKARTSNATILGKMLEAYTDSEGKLMINQLNMLRTMAYNSISSNGEPITGFCLLQQLFPKMTGKQIVEIMNVLVAYSTSSLEQSKDDPTIKDDAAVRILRDIDTAIEPIYKNLVQKSILEKGTGGRIIKVEVNGVNITKLYKHIKNTYFNKKEDSDITDEMIANKAKFIVKSIFNGNYKPSALFQNFLNV